MQSISPQELFDLLNSKDHAGVVDRKDEPIFTKKELDMLLDRSDLTWKKISEKQIEEEIERKKTKQTENFGYSPMTNGNDVSSGSAKHFKVIDTEGMPTGLQSVKED